MKHTFTLLAAFALSILSAFAQTSQDFESLISNTGTSPLTSACWQFTGVQYQKNNGSTIGKSKNLITTAVNASITTPYVGLVQNQPISFEYKLTGTFDAASIITVSLVADNGTSTVLGSVGVDASTFSQNTYTFSAPSPLTDVRKIVITFPSDPASVQNFYFIDNINFGGALNYNGQYNCNSAAITLPIKLKSFQGLVANEKVNLSWAVGDNETGSHFEVEKSRDGKEFKTIAIVNTTSAVGDEVYTYRDATEGSAYYRLRIVNNLKWVAYSSVLFVKNNPGVATATANALNLLQNPVQAALRFSFVSESTATTDVSVYNMTGVKVFHTSFQAQKGTNIMTTPLDGNIKTGTFVVEVKNNTNRSTTKFVKQ